MSKAMETVNTTINDAAHVIVGDAVHVSWQEILIRLAVALVIVGVGICLVIAGKKLLKALFNRKKAEQEDEGQKKTLLSLLTNLLSFTVYFAAGCMALSALGVNVESLLAAVEGRPAYVLISSSAVYPETLPQPFTEDMPIGENAVWGAYGMGKVRAEAAALRLRPDSYILRPPYLYGPMQNLYREPFVFDCARMGRPFYLPGDGDMPLQFFHIWDLCRMMEVLLEKQPSQRIYNVGQPDVVTRFFFQTKEARNNFRYEKRPAENNEDVVENGTEQFHAFNICLVFVVCKWIMRKERIYF